MTKSKKLTLLTALYLAQGLPYGFFTQALPVLLRSAGLSLPQVGLASLLTLPWALKFLWAPLVDRYQIPGLGLRKSWLLPLQLLSVALYVALGFFALSPDKLSLILIAFLLSNLLAASQDIATDAVAVDVLATNERGWANGLQVAGYRGGMILGGLVLLAFYEQLGWSGVMFSMAGVALACTIPVLLYRESPTKKLKARSQDTLKEPIRFFFQGGALLWGAVLLFYKFGHAAASSMIRPWLVDQHYALSSIAQILGFGGFVAGFFGAIAGGYLGSGRNRSKLLVGLGALQVLGLSSYLWPVLTEHAAYKVVIASALDNFTSGLATTVLFTLMMDACSRGRSASDYTVQACIVVVSQSMAAVFAGFAAASLGYSAFFVISSVIGVATIAFTAIALRRDSVVELLNPQKPLAGGDL